MNAYTIQAQPFPFYNCVTRADGYKDEFTAPTEMQAIIEAEKCFKINARYRAVRVVSSSGEVLRVFGHPM